MPTRRLTPGRTTSRARSLKRYDAVRTFLVSLNDDFTDDTFCLGFPSRRAAQLAWPSCRRDVWAGTPRMAVPSAAEQFDGFTTRAQDLVLSHSFDPVFPLTEVLIALKDDRAAISAFEARDPAGAESIASFLVLLRKDLMTIEAIARTLASLPWNRRSYPRELHPHSYYYDPRTLIGALVTE